jgi:hypothetical protein
MAFFIATILNCAVRPRTADLLMASGPCSRDSSSTYPILLTRHTLIPNLDYKSRDGTPIMPSLTPLQNGSTTLPRKLSIPISPPCYRSPEANRLLLLFPRSNQRVQIPIPRGAKAIPAAGRPLLVRQSTRQGGLPGHMRLRRFSPSTRGGTGHNLLPTSWLYGRPTQCRYHHAKRRSVEVRTLSGCPNPVLI